LKIARKDTADAATHMNNQIEMKNQEIKRIKEQLRTVQTQSLDGTYFEPPTRKAATAFAKPPQDITPHSLSGSDQVIASRGPKEAPSDLPAALAPGYRSCCPGGCISMEVLDSASRGSGAVNLICMNMAKARAARLQDQLEVKKQECVDLQTYLDKRQEYVTELESFVEGHKTLNVNLKHQNKCLKQKLAGESLEGFEFRKLPETVEVGTQFEGGPANVHDAIFSPEVEEPKTPVASGMAREVLSPVNLGDVASNNENQGETDNHDITRQCNQQ